jgi:LysR family transcriptional regulator, mexEF-oprN operon transcriptional activator
MDTIDHFNLRSFDLNLLVAFDALMEEGNVTRAARRLKIQQPAMSHNLSTLRVLFQDELFVRVGQTMRPTARANKLAGPIRNALNQAQAALASADVFDPATENRVFRRWTCCGCRT